MALLVETPRVGIRRVSVSAMDNNVYLLTSKVSGEQVLIDAADDVEAIRKLLLEGAADAAPVPALLRLIVTTHSHWDHIRALRALADMSGARLAAGADDVAAIEAVTGARIGEPLADGDTVGVAGVELAVIHLRGHTPGSVALALSDPDLPAQLFTGDSLFPGGVGNTGGDAARFELLFHDVVSKIFDVYDDSAVVWPGHGRPTTLGKERPALGEWKGRGW
ncbi:MAG: MBL fold metallo-hydrolase [Propionibacteriaceae bacterium]|jgi:glyoxylase-like metal-dependent hydrolase (beta-lactamase superfamily II)|nr:MBL fold metallo-hydrolase [Propionibacteriaceae bacterium]